MDRDNIFLNIRNDTLLKDCILCYNIYRRKEMRKKCIWCGKTIFRL